MYTVKNINWSPATVDHPKERACNARCTMQHPSTMISSAAGGSTDRPPLAAQLAARATPQLPTQPQLLVPLPPNAAVSFHTHPFRTTIMDSLTIYLLTFNCARNLVDVDRFSQHFFDALPLDGPDSSAAPPDLVVLSLQEIAPLAYAFLGGSFLTPYFTSLTQVVDRAVAQRWDTHYVNLLTDNSGMTGLLVFARSDIADHVSSVDTARVGFGFQEMGNKGAVGARVSYTAPKLAGDPVDFTFVAAHLAPMEYGLEQRNANWRSLVERLVFSRPPSAGRRIVETGSGSENELLLQESTSSPQQDRRGIYIPASYLFLAGDLNYRTSSVSPQKDDHTRFPRADVDPSDPRHFSHLLKQDQLSREMGQSRCFHGLSEAPITFPPTYKYALAARQAASDATVDSARSDRQWTRTRWPSWCDRVLYLDNTPPGMGKPGLVRPLRYDALPLFPTSDHRAVALVVSVPAQPKRLEEATEPVAPFPIDPEWRRKREEARRKELVVGCLAYLGWTWEGNVLLVATTVGILGAWLVLRSLFSI
ncbi:DNase I-like protein [Aspergillus ellipticus CBS 707.79]|uniref:DNase I-like protein n=1 Tax=Aspergillus ellipticus CBS 707.79 TaxID=1448320 RepID=A0A319DUZ7_9EURO|nr:DNase I-like protein [Aspergillus ellipticus CBS 707.79]